jgi:hypothetical protein
MLANAEMRLLACEGLKIGRQDADSGRLAARRRTVYHGYSGQGTRPALAWPRVLAGRLHHLATSGIIILLRVILPWSVRGPPEVEDYLSIKTGTMTCDHRAMP